MSVISANTRSVTTRRAGRARAADRAAPTRDHISCTHCGLGVPPALVDTASDSQFCCGACRLAYETIHACGLDQYYALRARLGDQIKPASPGTTSDRAASPASASGFVEFDDPAFLAAYATSPEKDGHTLRVQLVLEGVHCAACLWLVERLPRVVAGVRSARLDLRRSVVEIEWEPAVVALSKVAWALSTLGYRPHPVGDSSARDTLRRQDRDYLVRIGVAAACSGNAMLLAFALYSGDVAGMHPVYAAAFRWLSAAIGILSLAWPGRVFLDSAIGAMRARTWHLDMPIALSLVVGNAAGVLAAIRGVDTLYADSLTMLVFLLLVGRWLQIRQQRYALDAVELLFSLTPSVAHEIASPGAPPRDVSVESLTRGCTVEVRPQETFPVDGVVTRGQTTVDSSILTGESRPAVTGEGEAVIAGAVNLTSTVHVLATAVGRETRAARMMASIEEISRRRTPIIGSAQAFAAPFVVGVTLLSALTLAIHAPFGLEQAMAHAIALLVATCPCVIALATPLVVTLAVGRAAKGGMLVKGGDVFERLARPGTIVLDKTGTLTTGRFQVVEWVGDRSLQGLVARLEQGSPHPVAMALASCAEPDEAEASAANEVQIEHVLGKGVRARVRGMDVLIGASDWASRESRGLPAWATDAIIRASRRAQTPVVVVVDGQARAVAVLGDQVRPEARATIDSLRAGGWRVALLSGDALGVAQAVGAQLGLDPSLVWGGQSPEEKQQRIAELKLAAGGGPKSPPVVMVGDGVNDAMALACADVGVAASGGAEASLAAADVYLARGGLTGLVDLVSGSRRVLRTIRVCLTIALFYNLFSAGLALAGLLSPLWAAALMPISSMSVLAVAIRSRTMGQGRATRSVINPGATQ